MITTTDHIVPIAVLEPEQIQETGIDVYNEWAS